MTLLPAPPLRHLGGRIAHQPHEPRESTSWLRDLIQHVDSKGEALHIDPIVQSLGDLIDSKAELRMLANAMFDEVPDMEPYNKKLQGQRLVRGYRHMLSLFSVIMNQIAPSWDMTANDLGVLGAPFMTVLYWPMYTPSGHAFFLREDVNERFKIIMDTWAERVLVTSRSLYAVSTDRRGWLCEEALAAIEQDGNSGSDSRYPFRELFVCDPDRDAVHWGFTSWDDFFTRQFRDMDRLRPVAYRSSPEWVVSACESRPIALETDVKMYDRFWIKGRYYSVADMLDHHELAVQFVGGTAYQASLSATSYHRWSSPVSGDVVDAKVIAGKYFSAPPISGSGRPSGHDASDVDQSEFYCGHVATRAVFFINAPGPIGLMCVVAIGQADVSTCVIASKFNTAGHWPRPVAKGEEIGMFRHGGSTHCLLFRKGVKLAWVDGAIPGFEKENVPIRSALAMAY